MHAFGIIRCVDLPTAFTTMPFFCCFLLLFLCQRLQLFQNDHFVVVSRYAKTSSDLYTCTVDRCCCCRIEILKVFAREKTTTTKRFTTPVVSRNCAQPRNCANTRCNGEIEKKSNFSPRLPYRIFNEAKEATLVHLTTHAIAISHRICIKTFKSMIETKNDGKVKLKKKRT